MLCAMYILDQEDVCVHSLTQCVSVFSDCLLVYLCRIVFNQVLTP